MCHSHLVLYVQSGWLHAPMLRMTDIVAKHAKKWIRFADKIPRIVKSLTLNTSVMKIQYAWGECLAWMPQPSISNKPLLTGALIRTGSQAILTTGSPANSMKYIHAKNATPAYFSQFLDHYCRS